MKGSDLIMAISINSNFSLLSKVHLDSRQSFETLVDMASFLEGAIPEGFLTYNKETDKFYKFNASNTVDPTLGKWREFSSGSGENVIDDTSPGASGMQPRDPCRPWRGTLASGHKPR